MGEGRIRFSVDTADQVVHSVSQRNGYSAMLQVVADVWSSLAPHIIILIPLSGPRESVLLFHGLIGS